ncbi:MAG: T9SS type A sorting domain-containing protein [Ignavibacteriae bacterium]|nr:T9SS type A sorting domain-containing protein [Ignavibacteriota bacterium]
MILSTRPSALFLSACLVLTVLPAFLHAQTLWETRGLAGESITTLALRDGLLLAGTRRAGLQRSVDHGASWQQALGAGREVSCVIIAPSGAAFAGFTHDTTLFRSRDAAVSWDVARLFTRPVASLALSDEGYLYVGAQAVEFSTNDGDTWSGLPYFKYTPLIRSMVLNWAQEVFAIPTAQRNLVVRSTPHSNHWDFANMEKGCNVLAITASGTLFLGSDSGVYKLVDHIENWVRISDGLSAHAVQALVLASNGDMFCGTAGGGVFRSHVNGGVWAPMNDGLANLHVNTLALDASGRLFAGTESGVFRSASPVTSTQTPALRLSSPTLEQNAPNPFSASTVIRYSLPQRASVTLAVYDALGRRVAVLVEGVLEAGQYHSAWDAVQLPSGMYHIRLTAGNTSVVRTCLLVGRR